MLEQGMAEHGTVEALFTSYDRLKLSRIVGHKRTQRLLSEPSNSFLFT
jgi:hypothetical protein